MSTADSPPTEQVAEAPFVTFRLKAVLGATAGYAFLFGMLAWTELRSPFLFMAVVLAVNFLLLAQDWLSPSRCCGWAIL